MIPSNRLFQSRGKRGTIGLPNKGLLTCISGKSRVLGAVEVAGKILLLPAQCLLQVPGPRSRV